VVRGTGFEWKGLCSVVVDLTVADLLRRFSCPIFTGRSGLYVVFGIGLALKLKHWIKIGF
jgi:hypothetical protein